MEELDVNNNKYYTPTLEEFHVGFEFEYQDIEFAQWVSETYELNWNVEDSGITDYLEWGNLRVKYLNKEDIESLGFVNAINSFATAQKAVLTGEITMFYTKDNIVIVFNYKTTDMLPADYYITISIDKKIVFDGTIKNKSELIKLLKQLGIK